MEKRTSLVVAAVAAAGISLAAQGPAKADISAGTHLQSLSHLAVTVDEFGRPSVAGMDIGDQVSPAAKKLAKLAAQNTNCNCGCQPPRLA